MKPLTIILLLLGSSFVTFGQKTGSFVDNISFDKPDYKFTRKLYYYVPTDYDSANKYPLVVGFRGGPHSNAGEFRSQLQFLSDSIGAIILCPENKNHFNNEEGLVKQLFRYSVDTLMSVYNIDPNLIYVTGLSYGGRHAVIVAMNTNFGDIPKLRGIIPFATGRNGELAPNYDLAKEFAPSCICIGGSDAQIFKNVANQLYTKIIDHGGMSLLNEIPGIGHTVDFPAYPTEMMKCLRFIDKQYDLSLENNLYQDLIIIKPNPTKQSFELSYPNGLIPQKLFLTDSGGKLLMNIRKDQKRIDVSHLSKGLKILVIQSNKGMITKKILLE